MFFSLILGLIGLAIFIYSGGFSMLEGWSLVGLGLLVFADDLVYVLTGHKRGYVSRRRMAFFFGLCAVTLVFLYVLFPS